MCRVGFVAKDLTGHEVDGEGLAADFDGGVSRRPDGNEIADQFRALLLSWLTGPVPFDNTILGAVRLLGEPPQVGVRWGQDLRNNYDDLKKRVEQLGRFL